MTFAAQEPQDRERRGEWCSTPRANAQARASSGHAAPRPSVDRPLRFHRLLRSSRVVCGRRRARTSPARHCAQVLPHRHCRRGHRKRKTVVALTLARGRGIWPDPPTQFAKDTSGWDRYGLINFPHNLRSPSAGSETSEFWPPAPRRRPSKIKAPGRSKQHDANCASPNEQINIEQTTAPRSDALRARPFEVCAMARRSQRLQCVQGGRDSLGPLRPRLGAQPRPGRGPCGWCSERA